MNSESDDTKATLRRRKLDRVKHDAIAHLLEELRKLSPGEPS